LLNRERSALKYEFDTDPLIHAHDFRQTRPDCLEAQEQTMESDFGSFPNGDK